MKFPVLYWLGLLLPFLSPAQEHALRVRQMPVSFDSAAKVVLQQMMDENPYDTSEGGEVNSFARWSNFYRNRVSNDAPSDSNMLSPAEKSLSFYLNNQFQYCLNNHGAFDGNWKCIGPFNSYYGDMRERQGRIETIWVDPDSINHILAGGFMGGLWRSIDTGHTWHNITDPTGGNGDAIPGTMGVCHIAVNPLNEDMIYISLNMDGMNGKHGGYAMGLAYSTDRGQSWHYDADFLAANQQSIIDYSFKFVRRLGYMPGTSKLFALTESKVLYKANPYSNWQDITPNASVVDSVYFVDLEFSRLDTNKIAVTTTAINNSCNICVYNAGSASWTAIPVAPPANHHFRNITGKIWESTISGVDSIYILLKARRNSDSAGVTFLVRNSLSGAGYTQTGSGSSGTINDLSSIFSSPVNSSIIYGLVQNGTQSFFRSVNEGNSFTHIAGNTHPDARALLIHTATTSANAINDIVFGGSDGGVVMKSAGNSNFTSITGDSLVVTQFYGMSNTEADERYVSGGAQDNGIFAYVSDRVVPWQNLNQADNFLTEFANNGITQALIQYFNGNANVTFTGQTTTFAGITSPNDLANPAAPYVVRTICNGQCISIRTP
jgi:hypothetical protein